MQAQNKEKALFRHHCNKYWLVQGLEICRIGILFPIYSLCYVVCPWANFSQSMRKPFIKFICNSASYFFFLCKCFIFYNRFIIRQLKTENTPFHLYFICSSLRLLSVMTSLSYMDKISFIQQPLWKQAKFCAFLMCT